jgi:predicted small lipoprotein YifL
VRRLLLALLAFLLLAGPIAACGKLGPPEPAPGVKNTYPRTYPSGAS